jgi:hypothetical protein
MRENEELIGSLTASAGKRERALLRGSESFPKILAALASWRFDSSALTGQRYGVDGIFARLIASGGV